MITKIISLSILIFYMPLAMSLEHCSFKDIPLYGKVQIVDKAPDIKIKAVSYRYDLKVKAVSNFANSCGKWQIVDKNPQFKVKFVDRDEDIRVKFVDNYPGIK